MLWNVKKMEIGLHTWKQVQLHHEQLEALSILSGDRAHFLADFVFHSSHASLGVLPFHSKNEYFIWPVGL